MYKSLKSEQKSLLDSSIYLSTLKTTNSTIDSEKYKQVFIVSNEKFLNKKKFKTTFKYSKIKSISNRTNSHGLWDKSEHNKYIEALYIYNCDWFKVSKYIGNRTYKQIISHSQKFFLRLKNFKDGELGLDFTSVFVKSLKQIVDMIKDREKSLKTNKKLLYIISEKKSFGKNNKRKNEKKFLSDTAENAQDSCGSLSNNIFNCNFIYLNKEEEVNKNDIKNSSEINYLPKDNYAEKGIEEMSLVDIDNRHNLIFLQL